MNTIRTFTVKTIGGAVETIEVSPEDTFDTFCKTIKSTFCIDDDRRLKIVCNGGVVNEDKFQGIPDKALVICLATRPINTAPAPATVQSQESSSVTQVQVVESVADVQTADPTYSFKQVQAYTIVFMNFISANAQLRDAFLNNYGLLVTELAKNDQLMDVMKNILSQSGQIMESMEKGENISVNINTDNNSMEKIELTTEDRQKIDQLIMMGFNPDKVVVEYLKSGKDVQKTLEALQISN